ncbi:hypothetical protein AOC36_09800 [Erysipelothrix larvae]|uniref:Uncharacterized protein n=1 Tax=Erysipelothrix larvae TaxID=1514105 RepID=A0A109UHH5_9FIRM|nr:hypothetical protein [Erysipelothrix larvae]AMC94260.1 hypothetical protein AOC36_09800 [Erysipelothrix larvae]
MIYVQSPQKRDFIKELLDGQTVDGCKFTFAKMDGMKIYFETEGVELEKAVSIAKSEVKKSKYGPALYFTVQIAK